MARMVKNQMIWNRAMEEAGEHLKTYIVQPQGGDGLSEALTFNVSAFRPDVQGCGGLSPRAKVILTKPSWSRSEEELYFLHRFTLQLKCFERYPMYVRKELARVLCFQSFEKGRIVIRQGDIGISFYFILSGSVFVEVQEEDQTTGKRHNQIVGELEAGAAFGELALLHDSRRRATIVCKENSEFLTIDKPDFDMVLRKNHEREWKARLSYFKNHPLFSPWSQANLNFAVEGSQIAEFAANSVILKDLSTPSERVFFVNRGLCKVVQKVEIFGAENSLCRIGQKAFVLPTVAHSKQLTLRTELKPSEVKKTKKWWVVRSLRPGDFFGVGEGQSGMSVVSSHKVECLLVNKMVFMKHDRGRCLVKMRQEAIKLYPSSDAVLQSYIENQKWTRYKESVVVETLKLAGTSGKTAMGFGSRI